MKWINLGALFLCLLFVQLSYAQSLEQQTILNQTNYQAIVRNASGLRITDQTISIKVDLLKNGADGTIVFSESHQVKYR